MLIIHNEVCGSRLKKVVAAYGCVPVGWERAAGIISRLSQKQSRVPEAAALSELDGGSSSCILVGTAAVLALSLPEPCRQPALDVVGQ